LPVRMVARIDWGFADPSSHSPMPVSLPYSTKDV
jgi:hypothetical protein